MARRKRRMTKSPGRARVKADWVFRPNISDEAGTPVDLLGTYQPTGQALVAGVANSRSSVLYDSHNRMSRLLSIGNVPLAFPASARAEGSRAKIVRVMGELIIVPSVWALGSFYAFGIRFGIFEQNSETGLFQVDASYSMWDPTSNMQRSPAMFANDRRWQHERHLAVEFNDNNRRLNLRFAFAVNRHLAPDQCYGFYMETAASGVTINTTPFFKTLVADEG